MCSDHHKPASAITSLSTTALPTSPNQPPLCQTAPENTPQFFPPAPQNAPTHPIMTPHVANPGLVTRPHLNFHTSSPLYFYYWQTHKVKIVYEGNSMKICKSQRAGDSHLISCFLKNAVRSSSTWQLSTQSIQNLKFDWHFHFLLFCIVYFIFEPHSSHPANHLFHSIISASPSLSGRCFLSRSVLRVADEMGQIWW